MGYRMCTSLVLFDFLLPSAIFEQTEIMALLTWLIIPNFQSLESLLTLDLHS